MIKRILSIGLMSVLVATAQTNAPTSPKTISIQEMLVIGQSGMKLHSLAMITQGKVKNGVDESFLPGFIICANDPTTPVRSVTARLIGQHLVAGKTNPNPEAVALLITLAKDDSADVRYSAVYHGLTQVEDKSDEIIELLIQIAASYREQGLYTRIVESLKNNREQATHVLDMQLAHDGGVSFYEIYEDFTGKLPADADQYLEMPSSRPRLFIFKGEGNEPETFRLALETELKSHGIDNPVLFISGFGENHVVLLKTYLTKDSRIVKHTVTHSERFKITQEMWLTPELEIQIEAMRNPSE